MSDSEEYGDDDLLPPAELQLAVARISFRLAMLSKIILESMERSRLVGSVAYSPEDEKITGKIREEMMNITSTLLGMEKPNEPG